MKQTQEWDWPPTQRRSWARLRYRQTLDAYPRTGWTKKAIDVYWRVMVTVLKIVIAVPLTAIGIFSIWLLWFLLTQTT